MEYNHYDAAHQNTKFASQLSTSTIRGANISVNGAPSEPGLRSRIIEMLGYISEAENLQQELRRQLCGPFPMAGQSDPAKAQSDLGIEELLSNACTRTAMLVGEFKSLMARL